MTAKPDVHELQNHPTTRQWPVLPSIRHLRHVPGQPKGTGFAALVLVPLLIIASVALALVGGGLVDAIRHAGGNPIAGLKLMVSQGGGHFLLWTLAPLILALFLIPGIIRGFRGPILEQQRYYQLRAQITGQDNPFADEAAVRIGAGQNFVTGSWPRTIELAPLVQLGPGKVARELPTSKRFATFEPQAVADLRKELADTWQISSAQELQDGLEAGLHYGEQSLNLALVLAQDNPQAHRELAQSIFDDDAAALTTLLTPSQGVAPLLWAYDLAQLHQLARLGFMADYLSHTEAVAYLQVITETAVTIFPTEDAFLANYRLGAKFAGQGGADELTQLHAEFARQWAPHLCPWPVAGSGFELPATISTAFMAQREEAAAKYAAAQERLE